MEESQHTEGEPAGGAELTLDKMRAAMRDFRPAPRMPRWKDLTWAQRNMVEHEIEATDNAFIRGGMWEAYYCQDDDCPWHGPVPAGGQPAPAREED
jgi:hypothetical protein